MSYVVELDYQGFVWEIPAHVIANHYANNLAYEGVLYSHAYRECIEDREKLSWWLFNKMRWSQVKDHAVMVKTPLPPDDPLETRFQCMITVVERKERDSK